MIQILWPLYVQQEQIDMSDKKPKDEKKPKDDGIIEPGDVFTQSDSGNHVPTPPPPSGK